MSKGKTAAEKSHLGLVARAGCIVCRLNGFEDTPAAIHHIKSGITGAALRSSHYRVLPLCGIHHQHGDGTARHGGELAYHHRPKQWEARYGAQERLLRTVVHQLGLEWGPRFEAAPE